MSDSSKVVVHCVPKLAKFVPSNPANTTRRNNDVLMLSQRRRRWANVKTLLFQRVFAGKHPMYSK